MSKFVIEPNKIYDVNFCSYRFFMRVIERWYSDYKVEIACYPDFDDFSYFDYIIVDKSNLVCYNIDVIGEFSESVLIKF